MFVYTCRLLECCAEDSGIDDTLYCLDRALADDRIDIANFLKITRQLARKQFAARALALKIHNKLTETKGAARVPVPNNAFNCKPINNMNNAISINMPSQHAPSQPPTYGSMSWDVGAAAMHR